MGISQPDPELTSHDGALDEQYHRVKNDPHNTAGLPYEGTTQQITELHMRHFIMRETPSGSKIATWVNAMNEVAEGTRLGIPVIVAANSKNERGGFKLGATPEDVDFTQWPGTLGLAATGDLDVIADFAAKSRAEWLACGLRKGYMDRADTVPDPRWFRGNGTFGEDPAVNAAAIATVVRGFQGEDGLQRDGVAMTTKHFPGGGARENGSTCIAAELPQRRRAMQRSIDERIVEGVRDVGQIGAEPSVPPWLSALRRSSPRLRLPSPEVCRSGSCSTTSGPAGTGATARLSGAGPDRRRLSADVAGAIAPRAGTGGTSPEEDTSPRYFVAGYSG
jgi:hypothetical protein